MSPFSRTLPGASRACRLAMVAIRFAVVSGSAGSSIITPTRHDDAQWSLRWLG
jgi:hypothetical protein